ncbi:DpgD protein [Burkholderia humptydooensis]|uniref:DpgD protein n=2 Tax=Burkholderia humptydooensis TaxID=430531 RepID=A0A7U4SS01_9BURK|nr:MULTISPECIES: hypothetical protein [Burkholderia]AJY41904.1 putative dpgD protein [Burkholderia sp. 2002721687]ALX42323.1 DpgD protein [Burkholderia humptydooensis]EIP89040.1 DpgD protein [Burkholderia humptydooensis MSMB43]QPS42475.1 DpgD protein [Burkholderia humptydooensis]
MTHLHIERSARVLTVSFDNPPVNFLTMAMMRELKRLLGGIKRGAEIGVDELGTWIDGVAVDFSR